MFYMKKSIENNSDEFSPYQRKCCGIWRMVLILLKVFYDLNVIKRNIHAPPPNQMVVLVYNVVHKF